MNFQLGVQKADGDLRLWFLSANEYEAKALHLQSIDTVSIYCSMIGREEQGHNQNKDREKVNFQQKQRHHNDNKRGRASWGPLCLQTTLVNQQSCGPLTLLVIRNIAIIQKSVRDFTIYIICRFVQKCNDLPPPHPPPQKNSQIFVWGWDPFCALHEECLSVRIPQKWLNGKARPVMNALQFWVDNSL